ncbi:MAG: hypothetical protein ABI837_12560, partial [Acidobacteriota bacterium]
MAKRFKPLLRWAFYVIALVGLALPGTAQNTFVCGTGDPRITEGRPRTPDRSSSLATTSVPQIDVRDGIAFIPATVALVSGWHPFDLAGRTLTFTPQGASYSVRNSPVGPVGNRGSRIPLAGSPAQTAYTLPFP